MRKPIAHRTRFGRRYAIVGTAIVAALKAPYSHEPKDPRSCCSC